VKRWVNDLALGVRIALGGGRSSWRRLALTGVGVGLGVAVLLVGASMPTAFGERQARREASHVTPGQQPLPGVDPLYRVYAPEVFRGEEIMGSYVWPGGPHAPTPPGLDRIPGDGEIVVSPALADLFASPGGELLRPRFPQRVVGTISQNGLVGPNHLLFIAGDSTIEQTDRTAFYRFGRTHVGPLEDKSSWYWVLGLLAVVVLLLPVLVFVTISTRLAGPERERGLAALRLLGASARQVRRIATGDALAGAVAGLVLGSAVFLVLRAFVERFELFGVSMFADDLTPHPVLAALVVVAVPALAVVTSLVTMRGSVVDPLGVVRQAQPARRRLWWRFVPILIGVGLLASQADALLRHPGMVDHRLALVAIALLLLGIPLLLPWIVERSVGRLRGGPPSWQLAVRRLQLDSGSAARVVGGVAVVLAGGIALQTLMVGEEANVLNRPEPSSQNAFRIYLPAAASDRTEEVAKRAEETEGVKSVVATRWFSARSAGSTESFTVTVGSCATLRGIALLDRCQDGDGFRLAGAGPKPGERVEVLGDAYDHEPVAEWTVPDLPSVQQSGLDLRFAGILLTPGALLGLDIPTTGHIEVVFDPSVPEVRERVAAALGSSERHELREQISALPYFGESLADYQALRRLFLVGTLIVVVLAGASLLVLGLEQVRTRRRPLAVLAAGGVPRSTLAWSLLWQNAVPLVLAVVVAVVVGSGTGLLFQRATLVPLGLDPAGIGVLVAGVVGMVLLVTLCTMPAVRRATSVTELRAE
jgi:hypothetical protein